MCMQHLIYGYVIGDFEVSLASMTDFFCFFFLREKSHFHLKIFFFIFLWKENAFIKSGNDFIQL